MDEEQSPAMAAPRPLIGRKAFFWIPVIMIIVSFTALDGHMIMTARGQTTFFGEPEMLILLAVIAVLSALMLWRHVHAAPDGFGRQLFWLGQVLFIYGLLAWSGQFLEAARMKITISESIFRSPYSIVSLILFFALPVTCGTALMAMKANALFASARDLGITVALFLVYFLIVAWLDASSPYFAIELVSEVVVPFIASAFVVARIAFHRTAPTAANISPPPPAR